MGRGEVWWVQFAPPVGRRPVLLVTHSEAYGRRSRVTVALITTRIRGLQSEVRLGSADEMPRECVANLDELMTIPVSDLAQRITSLAKSRMDEVDAAIRFALGL
jgi:mRNA interferase MazF